MQKSASTFFQEKIKASDIFHDQSVLLVDYKLKDQIVNIGSVQMELTAEIVMTYSGKVLEDFPTMLSQAIGNEEIQYLIRSFVQDGFLGPSSTSSSVKYTSNGTSSVIHKEKFDKYTLLFIVLISISSLLALTTFAILIASRCRKGARTRCNDFQTDIKVTSTEDTEPISPPGILGAEIQRIEGDAVITPQRNIINTYDETPMSMGSNATEAKSTFSTTSSKAPLGIMSMNNLRNLMFSPERKKSTLALYDVGLNDDDDDHAIDEKNMIDEEKQEGS